MTLGLGCDNTSMRVFVSWVCVLLWWCCGLGVGASASDCAGDLAIQTADDITALNACATFTGNVSLGAKGMQTITLDGLKAVTGTISITDSDAMLSISSTTLEAFTTLTLNNLPNLTTLALPALTNFSKLDFTGLTSLKGCDIATGSLQQDVREISIIDTAMEKMDWIRWPVATALTIAANMNLTAFTLPYDTISTGSSYQFSINRALKDLNFSNLSGIYGSLSVNGNQESSLNFDKLQSIDGYVKLSGPFTNITMPKLQTINGALRAESTVDILKFCNWLSIQSNMYGHYDCTANDTVVYTSTSSKSPSSTATPSAKTTVIEAPSAPSTNPLSTGAIIGIAIAMVFLISIILTACALLFFRRRSRARSASATHNRPDSKKTHSTSTLGEEIAARFELRGDDRAAELAAPRPAEELEGGGVQELECEKMFHRGARPAVNSPVGRFELP